VLKRICDSGRIFNAWSDEAWVNEGAAVRVSLVCFDNAREAKQTIELDGQLVAEILRQPKRTQEWSNIWT